MNERSKQVDQYLAKLNPERREALSLLRSLILHTAPDAVESMKYKMPTYLYGEAVLCAFASQKHYMSLYVEPRTLDSRREELRHLNLGKSCVRFKHIDQLPLEIVRTILAETVKAVDADRGRSR